MKSLNRISLFLIVGIALSSCLPPPPRPPRPPRPPKPPRPPRPPHHGLLGLKKTQKVAQFKMTESIRII